MRILLYSANFAPEPTGIGKYSGELAAWLAVHGHAVRVVAAPPYYPEWKINEKYRWPLYRCEQWRGVEVWRCPLWVPRKPGGVTRLLHLLSFAMASFPVMIWQATWRPDVVITVAPAFMCAPAGLITARLSSAKAWLHIQDFEVDVAFGLGLLKGKFLQQVVLRMERWILQRFDQVSTISRRMVERLLIKGVAQLKTKYFPNWVDLDRGNRSISNRYREELGITADTVVVLFSGTLGGKQGLMVIPEAAAELTHRKDILFLICGDGVMGPVLMAATEGMANVRMLPLQPSGRVADLLSMADVHLLTQSPDAADLVLPSKLSGMLASGRPVIATCRPGTEICGIVFKCGLVVAPEDGKALARAVEKLADDASSRAWLGRAARTFAEDHFDGETVLGTFFGALEVDLSGEVKDVVT